ncbi:hypothetical protein [Neorhizobium alkalisoli]|uniref:hypothetical protein n=1 Tax=Neorhizobium alkalisoli TaxID=528178 RepID=UPI000CF9C231|nr:hypothetical protein [Neorhizobium alkalisoli]
MQSNEPGRFGSSHRNIEKSSGTGEDISRGKADPTTAEINKARKAHDAEGSGNPNDHVADAGDAGGQNLPYSAEAQADVVGRPTGRKDSE